MNPTFEGQDGASQRLAPTPCALPSCSLHFYPAVPSQKYCTKRCRQVAWSELNPRLRATIKAEPGRKVDKVLGIMADGKWRTVRELALMVGCSESGASARLRDLRKDAYGKFNVERRTRGARVYIYRILLNPEVK